MLGIISLVTVLVKENYNFGDWLFFHNLEGDHTFLINFRLELFIFHFFFATNRFLQFISDEAVLSCLKWRRQMFLNLELYPQLGRRDEMM